MKRVEEYFILRDDSSTIRIAKLDCHSIRNGKAILRHSGVLEEYEIVAIYTYKGIDKDIIEYELGACLRCIVLKETRKGVKV